MGKRASLVQIRAAGGKRAAKRKIATEIYAKAEKDYGHSPWFIPLAKACGFTEPMKGALIEPLIEASKLTPDWVEKVTEGFKKAIEQAIKSKLDEVAKVE